MGIVGLVVVLVVVGTPLAIAVWRQFRRIKREANVFIDLAREVRRLQTISSGVERIRDDFQGFEDRVRDDFRGFDDRTRWELERIHRRITAVRSDIYNGNSKGHEQVSKFVR